MENILKITGRTWAVILLLTFLFTGAALSAQSDLKPVSPEPETAGTVDLPRLSALPSGYGGIKLGMGLETVKDLLGADPNFNYRGEPDVTMMPQDKQELIDCEGVLFVDRAFFQFEDEKLYLIIMVMDQEYIDHYSIYTAFLKKYGEPDFLNPSKANWENEDIIISLERPLSIKYMDRKVFEGLQADSEARGTMEAVMREDFINSF